MRFALAATVALAASADAFPHMARHLQAHHDIVERAHAADLDDRGLLDPIGDFFGGIENGISNIVNGVTGNIKGPTLDDLLGTLTQGRIPALGDFVNGITKNLKGQGVGNEGQPTSIFDALTKSLTPDGKSIDFSKMDEGSYDNLKTVLGKLDLGDIGSKINLGSIGGIGDGNIDIGPFRQAVPKIGDGIDLGKLNLVAGVQQLGIRGMDFLTQLAGEFKTFNPVTMAQFALQIKQARDEITRRAKANPEFGGWPSGLLMNEWAKDLTKDKIYDAYKLHRPDDEHGIWGGGEDADHPYQAPGPDDVVSRSREATADASVAPAPVSTRSPTTATFPATVSSMLATSSSVCGRASRWLPRLRRSSPSAPSPSRATSGVPSSPSAVRASTAAVSDSRITASSKAMPPSRAPTP